MIHFSHKLGIKLATISGAFLMVAFLAIGLTLSESWNLEGAGASINALGSERMRSYHIAYLLADTSTGQKQDELEQAVADFESTLKLIRRGDPKRPLYLPKSETVYNRMHEIELAWGNEIRPLIERVQQSHDPLQRADLLQKLHTRIEPFVTSIDDLVLILEKHSDNNLSTLRTLQVGLLALALLGTFVLIGLMYIVVVRPILTLRDGMLRMQGEDFEVRLPVKSMDELGELAVGFNNMADHLQQLYDTLEQRVQDKTRILQIHRDELKTLYEITALLAKAQTPEEMCREFLRELMTRYGAAGGTIRLVDRSEKEMHLFIHEGLSPEFVAAEQCRNVGDCLCGEVTARNEATVRFINKSEAHDLDYGCIKVGYRTTLALPILLQGRSLGLCNLFFHEEHAMPAHECKLLETLNQNLGIAIESLRMVAAEKELAISAERNLIAQELHDSIAQSLAFLNLQVQMLESALEANDMQEAQEDLKRIRAGVQESYEDVRELLIHFRTRVSQSDLDTELSRAIAKFEAQSGIKTTFVKSGTALPLPIECQAQALYIVQEALSNIRKHAKAGRAEISMTRGEEYRFTVRDDGRGLDAEAVDHGRHGGIGMSIMRERIERIGGKLEINSQPGQGTEVVLCVPTRTGRIPS